VVEQGEDGVVVGGLDGRDGGQVDAFVSGVEPLVGDAETGGGLDAEAGEVVADVRGSGDSFDGGWGEVVDGGGGQGGSYRGEAGQVVSGPAVPEGDGARDSGGVLYVDRSDDVLDKGLGVFAGVGGGEPEIDVDIAAVGGDEVALTPVDGGDGEPGWESEFRVEGAGLRMGSQGSDQLCARDSGVAGGVRFAASGVSGDAMAGDPGAQEAASSDDESVIEPFRVTGGCRL
jgi:hypothetical protein